jgi:tripartite-type tricarboxylate transporter receptor subunit TctC
MRVSRRQISYLLAAAGTLPVLARSARAQSYPTRGVRIVVGYAAGGATDIVARLTAQWLTARLGQQFIVENRPGAASNLATGEVIRAAPDGYTLLAASAANAINPTLYEKLGFDFLRDMEAVAGIVRMQNVLEVHPSVPARTVPEFIAYAREHPDKLSFGSAGIGSPGHVSGELFKMMTGTKMLHIPYRGIAPALSDLLGGQIQVLIDNMATALSHIRSGAVRALAVTSEPRSKLLSELPTVGESVPGYEASSWYGLMAPKGTPRDAIATLNGEVNACLSDPATRQQFEALGGEPLVGSPDVFRALIAEETEKWAKVVRFAGAKPG